MKESKNHVPTMYESIPAVAALNKVPGFDPLKFLRRTISPRTKKEVLRLDLPYKKLWFRLAHPKGRIRVNALRVTEQLAIYEAQVYLDMSDGVPVANFTSQYTKEDAPDGLYIQAAQQEAINEALTDAGFGLQFADVGMTEEGMRFGSEIPLQGNPVYADTSPVSRTAAANVQETVKTASAERKPVPAAQKTAPAAASETRAAAGVLAAQEKTVSPAIQEKQPLPAMQEAAPDELPVTAMREEALPIATAAQEDQLPVMQAIPTETLPLPSATQEQTLPVPPAAQTEILPIPPAVQRQEPATVQEEETLPVPGPAPVQKADVEKPAVQQPEGKAEAQTAPAKEELSEAQKAAQILYRNPAAEKAAAAETPAKAQELPAGAGTPKYTQDMPVEEIVKLMTYEEARNVVVDEGTCAGWTVGEVAERRRPSLKFYLYGGYRGGNILKAAAKIMLDTLTEQKAG